MMRFRPVLWTGLLVLSACGEATAPVELRPDDPLLPAAARVVGLAMSFQTTCALTADGRLHCWGENRFGEFGDGTTTASAQAVPSGGALRFATVAGSMGTPQMCGITTDGPAYCWGYNVNGELGDGTTSDRASPVRIDAPVDFRALASSYHSCGLATDGTAYCWGSGLGGQLGTGNEAQALRPAPVQTDARFAAITNGKQFSCALTVAGDAHCWGWGMGLGSGPADRSVSVPTPVSGGLRFASIAAGEEHVCAATTSGELHCWGNLASAPGGFRSAPARIPSSVPITAVVSAERTAAPGASCGLTAAGDAYCWHSGQAPVPVPGGYRFAGLTGGRERFCGFTPGGAAFCWRWTPGGSGRLVLGAPERIPSLPTAS